MRSRSGRQKCADVLRCAQWLRIRLVETDGLAFLEQYYSPPVANLQKNESRKFVKILKFWVTALNVTAGFEQGLSKTELKY